MISGKPPNFRLSLLESLNFQLLPIPGSISGLSRKISAATAAPFLLSQMGDLVLIGDVTSTVDIIYKIVPASLWREAQGRGRFASAPADLAGGFIHFSTAEQVEMTAAKHFRGTGDLLLIAVDTKRLGDGLRFEPSRGGMLFPHLYADLPLDAVAWAKPLPLRPDGGHDFAGILGITDET